METLRILGERSRDGSADIWMSAISICCLWDLFSEARRREQKINSRRRRRRKWRRGSRRKKKNPAQAELFLGWMDTCFISCLALAQQGQLFKKQSLSNISSQKSCSSRRNRRVAANVDKNSLSCTHNCSAVHTCTCLWCVILTIFVFFFFLRLWSVSKDNVCGHDNSYVDEWMSFKLSWWCLFFSHFPLAVGSCSSEESDCWNLWIKHSQSVKRLLLFAWYQATETQTFPPICIPVIAVLLTLHHKLNLWVITDPGVASDCVLSP